MPYTEVRKTKEWKNKIKKREKSNIWLDEYLKDEHAKKN